VTPMRRILGFPLGLTLLVALLTLPSPAAAGTAAATFRLAVGHAARPDIYFTVAVPGTVEVEIASDPADQELQVVLYAGALPVHSTQGAGRLRLRVQATRAHLEAGHEWAVIITTASPATRVTGRVSARFPDPPRGARDGAPLDRWLRARPALGHALTWNDRGRVLPYSVWPAGMRERLWALADDVRAGRPAPVADPPANDWKTSPGDDPQAVHTAFRPEVARELYLATVAHSLVVEMDRRVPWSLTDLNGDELEALLSSASLFWWNGEQQAYEVSEFDHGWAVPALPHTSWAFLQRHRLLQSTRLDTIVALLGWARGLVHFAGPVSRENFQAHWGYDGDMPVARALAGTRYSGAAFGSMPGYGLVRSYIAGCHGTAGLLLSVLRAANIPVRTRGVSNDAFTHATVIFLSEDRALSHGDDPYSQLAEGAEPASMLIDLATYNTWLGPLATDAGRQIGRQAMLLGIERLPPAVRRAHALDLQQGVERAQSAVYALFRGSFTVAELEEAGLWERLDRDVTGTRSFPPDPDAEWMEAEDLKAESTGGVTEVQDMSAFPQGAWRGDRQLWWREGRPGARLDLPLEVAADGVYRLFVRFTRAPDYAIVAITLDQATAPLDRVSLYAPQVVAADPLPLGEHALAAGRHTLRFSIVGSHPQATPAFMVGIDAIRLERVK
jgi:hypothetical protein